jgi:hypothetical protein
MSDSSEVDSLNSVKYLFLHELTEPRDNSLRLVVQEAKENPGAPVALPGDVPELAQILKGCAVIEPMEGCKSFELLWMQYVAYLVTEECAGSCGNYADEVFEGKLFRVYTKSHFLDHLVRDTGGHVKPVQHFKLTCLNHLIDVASYAPPRIRLIGLASPPALGGQ